MFQWTANSGRDFARVQDGLTESKCTDETLRVCRMFQWRANARMRHCACAGCFIGEQMSGRDITRVQDVSVESKCPDETVRVQDVSVESKCPDETVRVQDVPVESKCPDGTLRVCRMFQWRAYARIRLCACAGCLNGEIMPR